MVSSLDPDHPAEGAIDSDDHTYWISTGLYPQEMLLELGRRGTVSSVRVVSTHVRRVRIEGCWEEQPLSFAVLAEQDIEDTGGRLQLRELRCGAPSEGPLSYVRVVVVSGWLDFCSLHKIEVEGEVADVGEAAAAPVAAPAPGGGGGPPGGDLGLGGRRWLNEWEATGGSELSAGACPHDEAERQRQFWLQQVRRDGWRLEDAPAALRADREVVLAAVSQYGLALAHAVEALREDREVVMAALNQDPWAGQYMGHLLLESDLAAYSSERA